MAGGKQGLLRWRWWAAALALTALFVTLVAMNVSGLRDRLRGRTGAPRIQSLAVLPLENLSHDSEQEYFADGMTEALTTDLGKIGTLRVISRTSAMSLKGTHKTLPEIGRELNVDVIVEGAVRLSGNRVRITVQLVQTATDRHLWAETYERDVQDVFAIQDEVAGSIANALRLKLGAGPRRYTDDLEAYQLYLRGRYALDRRIPVGGSMGNALQYFEQACSEGFKLRTGLRGRRRHPPGDGLPNEWHHHIPPRGLPAGEGRCGKSLGARCDALRSPHRAGWGSRTGICMAGSRENVPPRHRAGP